MFELHPLCTLFPPIDDEGLSALREDIHTNGQQSPIVLLDGKILDGRNRYNACLELDVEPVTIPFAGGDPLAFVLSVNLHRRHLDAAQRATVASRLANITPGQFTGNQHVPSANLPTPQVSQADAARMLNVSTRSVTEATKILKADPDLADEVAAGGVSLHAASKVARLPEEQRKEAVAGGAEAINKAAKTAKVALSNDATKQEAKPDGSADQVLIEGLREIISNLEDANRALTELNKDIEQENKALLVAVDPDVHILVKKTQAYAKQLEERRDGLMASEAKLMSELKKAERKNDRLQKALDAANQGGGNG